LTKENAREKACGRKRVANKSDKKSPIFRTPLPVKENLLDERFVPAAGTFPIIILWYGNA
jgi:hypothetical protein